MAKRITFEQALAAKLTRRLMNPTAQAERRAAACVIVKAR